MNRHRCDSPFAYYEKGRNQMLNNNKSAREWDCTCVEVGFYMYKQELGMNGSQDWIIT